MMMFAALLLLVGNSAQAQQVQLKYQASPVDNPLKGLVPYWGQAANFPCSMEFWYFSIRDLMIGPNEFDWSPIEEKLEQVRRRGNQMVIRTYLEYPGRPSAMPKFLSDQGVKLIEYQHEGKRNLTPDYHDPKLIEAMERFVAAFGKKYDGDPRVGFITMGVLGHWGEWHTYPREKLFASKANQTRVQDAFAMAFQTTKVLMRYPAGSDDWAHAPNHTHPFGYHDDSFAWATLDTGKPDDAWFFETAMKQAGKRAIEKWKTQPVGGEIRPEIWGCVFDSPSCAPKGQEFETAVKRLHVSWLMDSGMFALADPPPGGERIAEAKKQVRQMGYELFIASVKKQKNAGQTQIELKVENKGVAPFYYRWPVEVVQLDASQTELAATQTDWDLTRVLPGQVIQWRATIATVDSASQLAIRIPNPMSGGKPLRFANETQRENGLLLLGRLP